MSGRDDADEAKRNYKAPYTPHHQIPTIQKYQQEKAARQAEATGPGDGGGPASAGTRQRIRHYWSNDKENERPQEDGHQDKEEEGREDEEREEEEREGEEREEQEREERDAAHFTDQEPNIEETSEVNALGGDAKQRRKGMKKRKDERAQRQVTDPVTHLPVTIHDFTSQALDDLPENDAPFGSTSRSATGLSNKSKSNRELQMEHHEMEQGRESMQALYPPPSYERIRQEIVAVNKLGITVGVVGIATVVLIALAMERLLSFKPPAVASRNQGSSHLISSLILKLVILSFSAGGMWLLVVGVRDWMAKRINDAWEDEMWEASRDSAKRGAKAHDTESVTWLNSLLHAVWPLVNPDLFASLADTLEDVMQASLPRLVQMVAVDDLGQGSEAIRILGIRWLPTGAAARSVSADGKLKSAEKSKHRNDRAVPGEGEVDESGDGEHDGDKNDEQKQDDGTEKQVAEGMEAEEGDFINLEVAFAYRARSSKLKDRAKDMHLYIAFYLPGNLKIPVWVDVRGIVGTMRLRLQLAPDPPFFALCTLTFLGQPKVDLSCVPLVKHGLNLMDLPLISNFVQSSVDAAMAEYVAPKSLTLDLKDMLAGDDFKKDTNAKGVIVAHIKRGYEFKMGDPGIPLIKEGSSDPYVSVGWAKFGKAMWSTRILPNEMEPCWQETCYLLVTPEELNVDERLRIQLWDSDRFNADDDLGRIEIDLKGLMRGESTNGRMQDRRDGFIALEGDEKVPGKLEWSVGYFSKTRIQKCQLEKQTFNKDIRSMETLDQMVNEDVTRKLREANIKSGKESEQAKDQDEFEQQRLQDRKAKEDAMIISAPPPDGYPSGIFSIQVHQITGLELENLHKNEKRDEEYDDDEQGQDLPSPYCTVIINHHKIFKTRTKPKNAKPFFNAGVERYIPDWRTAEVFVSVRDSRVKEDDPLLGIVHLPLGEVFKKRSQVNEWYPIMGGVGYGRIRVSMVWRSVQLQPRPQDLGWEYGTLEVQSGVTAKDLPSELHNTKIRFHTDLGYGKMYSSKDGAVWHTRRHSSLRLPVKKRFASAVALEFRHHGVTGDKTAAFAVLWLRDIRDEEDEAVTLPAWKGNFKRARACCLDDMGERLGSITLRLKFWSGLGGAHTRWAKKDPNVANVVEVLQCARDDEEGDETARERGVLEHGTVSDSDVVGSESSDEGHRSDDDDDDDDHVQAKQRRPDGDVREDAPDDRHSSPARGEDTGRRTIVDSVRDYRRHMQSEHRKNRGLMQWKLPRTAQFAKHKVQRVGERVVDLGRHRSREPGIETEV
ncbi:meiotically up-regulated protein [Teratosphaeria destructans]|uniref:Meiotically up-regulated protein n=1 Tax=Teratosphaeria destructans TaxID=418781 RepID=A0A9W7SQD8_9PEZI|nr:meiotically up-regulated protein [Teratosphaeria destructans]